MTFSSDYEKNLVFGDMHRKWHNKRAIDLMLNIACDAKPDKITANGDILDCFEISRFEKPVHLKDKCLSKEIEDGRAFFSELRGGFGTTKITYIYGNHEHRWSAFLMNHARELWGLEGLTLAEQLHLKQLDITPVYSGNRESSWLYGKVLIGHFDAVNQNSAYTAKNLLDRKGISLIQGHTHRGGSSYKRLWDRDIVAHEGFCLCDCNPQYVDHPNWQLGFLIVYKHTKSDHFFIEPHPISQGTGRKLKCFYNGRCYTA